MKPKALYLILLLTTLLLIACGGEAPAPAPTEAPERSILKAIFQDSWEALQNRSFRAIFLGLTLAAVAFGLMGALALHFATYFWGISTRQLFLWGVAALVSQVAGFYFWTWFSHRWDKKPTFLYCCLLKLHSNVELQHHDICFYQIVTLVSERLSPNFSKHLRRFDIFDTSSR